MQSIRLIVVIACHNKWIINHGNVPNAYLNGYSQKFFMVRLPPLWNEFIGDSIRKSGDPVVCVKSLYGSPDAGRNWNSCQHELFIRNAYTQCSKEPCLYYKRSGQGIAILLIWVDDNLITGNDQAEIDRMIGELKKAFDIKMLGRLTFALVIQFEWSDEGVKMTQIAYLDKIAEKFGMLDAKLIGTPMQKGYKPQGVIGESKSGNYPYQEAIGSLIYLTTCTRPDIAFAVNTMARHSQAYTKDHWDAVKMIIRYVKMTRSKGLKYPCRKFVKELIDIFPDSSYNTADMGRSADGFILFLYGMAISW